MTPTVLGVAVTAASLVVMPLLGRAKQRLGKRLDSGATVGEGMQNYLCAVQAGAVLLGLGATAAFGWSWLDPVIGLLLAGWAVYEGIEAWRGEDCCKACGMPAEPSFRWPGEPFVALGHLQRVIGSGRPGFC